MTTTIQKLEKLLGWLAPIQFLSIDAVNEAISAIKQKDKRIAELEARNAKMCEALQEYLLDEFSDRMDNNDNAYIKMLIAQQAPTDS
jgi:hypothetical protein